MSPPSPPRYPAHTGEPRHAESPAYSQSLEQWNKLPPIVSHIRPDFPEPYELPVDGLRGKTSILVILFTSFSGSLVSGISGAVQSGQALTGKDGILTPLIKQLTETALAAELDSHLAQDFEVNRKMVPEKDH